VINARAIRRVRNPNVGRRSLVQINCGDKVSTCPDLTAPHLALVSSCFCHACFCILTHNVTSFANSSRELKSYMWQEKCSDSDILVTKHGLGYYYGAVSTSGRHSKDRPIHPALATHRVVLQSTEAYGTHPVQESRNEPKRSSSVSSGHQFDGSVITFHQIPHRLGL
jgi:hypothetical protein